MKASRLLGLVGVHLRASRTSAAFAVVGVAVGVAFLCFFVGLGEGLRARVLNRIFPADQIEIEPRSVRIFGVQGTVGQAALDQSRIDRVAEIPGVKRALGKQKSSFPAKLWGGRDLLGYNLHTEAFFDGLPAELLRPELAEFAGAARAGPEERCDVAEDCPPGARCVAGACERVVWAARFDASDLNLRCVNTSECGEGQACVAGACAPICGSGQPPCGTGRRCVQPACKADTDCPDGVCGAAGTCEVGACRQPCRPDAAEGAQGSCRAHQACAQGPQGTFCAPMRCRLGHVEDQRSLKPKRARGRVLGAEGVTERPCPPRLYCAADTPDSVHGRCEWPVPTVVNPLLLEVFNTDMAASLNIARVASPEILYGVRYHIALGDSHFTRDAQRSRQQTKQAVVVGFSAKAPELGVAMPLAFVRHHNARIRGRDAATTYDAVLVEVASNEQVAAVIQQAESMGFSLSRRSRVARTFGTVVFLVYLALVLLSLVVLAVAGANITHTLAMLVHERRRELAVLRALGGTQLDIALLVVLEGAVLGVVGGLVGCGAAWVGAAVVERLAADALKGVPLVPEHFFDFPPWLWAAGMGVAVAFCVLGSIVPARRATKLDPAAVLSQP